ncbi:hypothetical protein AJ79_08914 [Helicocarpus griseus UAMH5409]|uniref:A-kinase anchor protein 7-like phosphoesterase domain-containing protein n=1 Tax=Helicocarpus griseus UAMH5409 TaxID=1447875 RepID=A0A2B7WP57_9EURO|nr:hypothetical protein AJ79_08914 [Helicocarpus griseus UAMH5409]
MAPKDSKPKYGGRPQNKNNSKPRLTHFLCLPLVNATSIPQLVSSLAEFKSAIPLMPPPVSARVAASAQLPHTPLLPDGALRPLGTLHLTLGVMSLPTQERLEEALNFLQSLDLESMLRDAETQARAAVAAETTSAPPQPLSINLTSLHALPRAKTATILHAQPVDATSRLYPFCVSLRNKFIEAGFIYQEMVKGSNNPGDQSSSVNAAANSDPEDLNGDNDDAQVEPTQLQPQPQTQIIKPSKPRPLLLHATIANTVYLPRRKQRDGKRKDTLKIDARELLMEFGSYVPPATIPNENVQVQGYSDEEREQAKRLERQGKIDKPPFVWARDVPIDRVCICEMGAKPVENDGDGTEGRPRLGEAYVSIAERSLVFGPRADVEKGEEGRVSEDGGVRINIF